MKKLLFILCLCAMTLVSAAWPALAVEPISVLVNGWPLALEVAPLIENGRTLVPVRAIAESLGASVGWDPEARRVEIDLNDTRLTLIIDNDIAYVSGVPKQLDAPARIVEGRTLVPTRFISESLRAEVVWDEHSRTVSIITYVDAAPYSAELAQMEGTVLQELNQRRLKLQREPLIMVEEYNQMARGHAAELARSKSFSHDSSRFGGPAERAQARGLALSIEYLAYGLPDAAAIVEALLSGEQGGRLLAAEARFFGLGLYKGAAAGNADIYAVGELTEGLGFILGARQRRLSAADFTLAGYATPGAPLTIYLLNEQGDYLSRSSYPLSVDGNGRFSFSMSLPQQGRFMATLGNDAVILLYE